MAPALSVPHSRLHMKKQTYPEPGLHLPLTYPSTPCSGQCVEQFGLAGPGCQITMLPLSLCSHLWGPLILLSAVQARSTDSLDGPGEGSVQPLPPAGGPSVKGKPGKR